MFSQKQTVFYNKDFKLELLTYDEEHILKCGEIFRHSNGNLSMTCVHCDLIEFSSFSDYAIHVDKHYNLLLNEKAINSFAKESNTLEFINTYQAPKTKYYAPKMDALPVMEEFTKNRGSPQRMVQNKRDLLSFVRPAVRQQRPDCQKKWYSCDYCDEKFSTKQVLIDHMMDVHQMGHGCEYCGKQFKYKQNLAEHIRCHTGERPYACTICPAHFASSNTMRTHIRYHKGEKPFLCSECGKSFTVRNQLTRHVQLKHSDEAFLLRERYPCTLCNRKYMHPRKLRDHMLSHNNERNIVCDICSKAFTLRKHIVQHMQLHSGVKSYTCRYCSATFAQAAGRRNHEKYNHESTIAV